jgi:uncharacterized protein
MLKEQIGQDLKQALLSGDKDRATTLRGLKSVILYAEVAKGVREAGLADEEIITLLAKEAKKRQESADLFTKGGADDRAAKELAEKKIIESYLPSQLSDEELQNAVDAAISEVGAADASGMGKVIGLVKQKVGASADGSRIAQMVKERLSQK